MKNKQLIICLTSLLLTLIGCNQKGDDPKPEPIDGDTHWYDVLVSEGAKASQSFPLDELKEFLELTQIPSELPSWSFTSDGFAYQVFGEDDDNFATFDVYVQNDVIQTIQEDLSDDFYVAYYDEDNDCSFYLKEDHDTSFLLSVWKDSITKDNTVINFTTLSFYKISDIFATTLTSATEWNKDQLEEFNAIGEAIPFMAFSDELVIENALDDDGVFYVYDYCLYDLTETYIEILIDAGYSPLFDEENSETYYRKQVNGGVQDLQVYWEFLYGNCVDVYFEESGDIPPTPPVDEDSYEARIVGVENASSITFIGYNAIKIGSNSKGGSFSIVVGANATKLSFYCAAWKDAPSLTLDATIDSEKVATINLKADEGVSGTNPTLNGNEEDYLIEMDLSNITKETTITFKTTATKRCVVWNAKYYL